MRIIYNIFIFFYRIGIRVYSLFNEKANEIVISQKKLLKDIYSETKGEKNIVWFHSSSLGEYEQGKSVMLLYKEKNPTHKILLTFYSPSGYNIIRNNTIADWVFYMPHDTKKNATFIADKIKPIKAIFIKYEFWYNYIQELYKHKIPIYFISSIFRDDQYFFKIYGRWFSKQLQKVNCFFVQDIESSKLLESINIYQTKVTGDSRFDTVLSNSTEKITEEDIELFINNQKIIVAGSTWGKDLQILKDSKITSEYKLIIAPHELNHLEEILKLENSILLSNLKKKDSSKYQVLIIDKIGILSKIYRYADIAYIGGGFGKGIHNTLEAVVYKVPVLFGPNYHKFREPKELISLGIAQSINCSEDFLKAVKHFEITNIKEISTNYINSKKGSAHKITESI